MIKAVTPKIYISGPISNSQDFRERFSRVEKILLGYHVINPTKEIEECAGKDWLTYLIECIHLIEKEKPDIIYLLEGWEKSFGARIEKLIFEKLGKIIEYENKDHNKIDCPVHYKNGNIECIDAIRAALTDEEFRGYCKGNVIKYAWREKYKDGNNDLLKIKKYIELYLEREKK